MPQTDEELASEVQRSNTQAFQTLMERYEPKLLRYAKKFLLGTEDAEDIIQEVFLKAYMNIQGFDTQRSFSSWIYRIAHNDFINAIKKKGREAVPFFNPDTLFPHPVAKQTADDTYKGKELKLILDECLEAIDLKYREPLILYFFEEKDYQEISDIMHIPISTVGVRLRRGKELLKKAYKQSRHSDYE